MLVRGILRAAGRRRVCVALFGFMGFMGGQVADQATRERGPGTPGPANPGILEWSRADWGRAALPGTAQAGYVVKPVGQPMLRAGSALVLDRDLGYVLYSKNPDAVRPIASITKIMTAMVALDAGLSLDDSVTIEAADVDTLKHTRSRLRQGTRLSRRDLLRLALMSSENRAAAALARSYPGGTPAFVARMNETAAELGMTSSNFADATGLSSSNTSTAWDLARMVDAGCRHELIREFTTTARCTLDLDGRGRVQTFSNTNPLVTEPAWTIGLSKTGYIGEAGPCLVMETTIEDHPYVIVILDAQGKYSRVADARRIRKWIESGARKVPLTG